MRRRHFLSTAAALGVVGVKPSFAAAAPFRVTVLGDCCFTRGLTRDDPQLPKLLPILRDADATIGNFEGTLADAGTWGATLGAGTGIPGSTCGGMNIRGDDAVAGDVAWLGIDLVGTSNNHASDWGPEGVLATNAKLSAAGIQHAGTGKDLQEARKPAYYSAKGVKVALISCASTFNAGSFASHSNTDVPGRPGLSPVRVTKGVLEPLDLNEIAASVREARANADIVALSCHTHESDGDRTNPPAFAKELAHTCIDAGADIYFSHGPHVLRGIELYKSKVIFHGLGAFIWRAWESKPLPEELFELCGPPSHKSGEYFRMAVGDKMDKDVEFWEAAIPQLAFDRGKITGITLTPTVLQHGGEALYGMPSLADVAASQSILARMQRLSEPFGTKLRIEGSMGRVIL